MIIKKITSRVSRVGLSFALLLSTITPLAMLLAPQAVSAAPCNITVGGGGGGDPFISMGSVVSNVDSAVTKLSVEATPSQVFTVDSVVGYALNYAKSDCTKVNGSYMYLSLSGNKLNIEYSDTTRVAPFVLNTDYANVGSGVTFSSTTNTYASATYTFAGMVPASVAQLISVDIASIANPGYIDVSLKQGGGADTVLVSLKVPTGAVSILNTNTKATNIYYTDYPSSFSTCGDVTAHEVKTRVFGNGSLIDQTATPSTGAQCSSFDKTSYDVATKTASLKEDPAGVAVPHSVSTSTIAQDSSLVVGVSKSLTDNGAGYFNDSFTSSSSASQQLYFYTLASTDGKSIPKDKTYPVFGGVFDLSAADINLSLVGVKFDVSATSFSAVVHNAGTVTKDGTFTLFVPYKDKDNFVGVCAGAANLTAVSNKCTGIYYLKDGQTKTSSNTKSITAGHSVKATVVTLNGMKFWQIDGLTGTGGFSTTLASDPATGISVDTTSTSAVAVAVMGTLALAFITRRYANKK